eukprot:CAMPEP_0177656444 /NCGR_PEP_ID=MMETSP0447-20121125/15575_1 /TAXON_ID=0 /ORGANISM="Stygamoeba regulata, Strain BSH-02190019" /LENGTH=162 /DNA_ID=CAMNT_0019160573 /DNA_START=17 /DNA_END=505 /DNA_ORIENTATION=+
MATITLQSVDGQNFTANLEAMKLSETIKNLVGDISDQTTVPIPLSNVSSKILELVIKYCTHHHEHPSPSTADRDNDEKRTDDIDAWDAEFCQIEQSDLFELILAANYLDIKPLLDLTCKTVANMIKGKTPEEIRKKFNIKNDFTAEEEEQVRKENAWCEERG